MSTTPLKAKKMLFQMHNGTIFCYIISRSGVQPESQRMHVLTEMPPTRMKRNYNNF